MSKDHEAQLRNLIAGYGDSIRLSDIKANIAVLFVAIMMGTVLGFRDNYPRYLNVPVLLAPFIVIFFSLLASVYPRFPREGESVSRSGASRSRRISSSSPIRSSKWRNCRIDARCSRGFSTGRTSPFRPPTSFRSPRSSPAGMLLFVAWLTGGFEAKPSSSGVGSRGSTLSPAGGGISANGESRRRSRPSRVCREARLGPSREGLGHAVHRRSIAPFRLENRGRQRVAEDRDRPIHRGHRPFGRRQVDAPAHDQPARAAELRPHLLQGYRRHALERRRARRLARPLRDDLSAIQPGRAPRRADQCADRALEPLLRHCDPFCSSGRRKTSRSRFPRSNSSISRASPRSAPTASRAASSSASRSPGRWFKSRKSFSPTNRSRRSIRATPASSWTRCCASTAILALPCFAICIRSSLRAPIAIGWSAWPNGRVVFEGAPGELTDAVARELYGIEAKEAVGDERLDAPAGASAPAAA